MSAVKASIRGTVLLNLTILLSLCLLCLYGCEASPPIVASPSPYPTTPSRQEPEQLLVMPSPSLTNTPEPTPTSTNNTQYLGLLYGRPVSTPTTAPTATKPVPSPTIAAAPAVESTSTELFANQVNVSVDLSCSQFNAPGDDNLTKEEEYVCFRNESGGAVDLTGWSLSDEYGWRFQFPSFTLARAERVRVRTGCGIDTHKDLYWCKDGTAVWNNGGDCVYLIDGNGGLVSQICY
jgi:hypothetical protein